MNAKVDVSRVKINNHIWKVNVAILNYITLSAQYLDSLTVHLLI